jgi:hypothetical protein
MSVSEIARTNNQRTVPQIAIKEKAGHSSEFEAAPLTCLRNRLEPQSDQIKARACERSLAEGKVHNHEFLGIHRDVKERELTCCGGHLL